MAWIAALVAAAGSLAAGGISASGSKGAGNSFNSAQQDIAKLLDIGTVQSNAVQANLDNFGAISDLTHQTDNLNMVEMDRMLASIFPNYKKQVDKAERMAYRLSIGEIPKDVAQNVTDRAAEKSLRFGFAGSGAGKALVARDLGLTSVDLMKTGTSMLQSWFATARSYLLPQPFDPSSMYVTPALALQAATQQAGLLSSGAAGAAQGQAQGANAIAKGVQGAAGAIGGAFAPTGAAPAGGVRSASLPAYEGMISGVDSMGNPIYVN